MDVHALGALLGAWREGICSSTMPLHPTRGQWLPYRGHDMEKASFSPSSAHLSEVMGSNPETMSRGNGVTNSALACCAGDPGSNLVVGKGKLKGVQ